MKIIGEALDMINEPYDIVAAKPQKWIQKWVWYERGEQAYVVSLGVNSGLGCSCNKWVRKRGMCKHIENVGKTYASVIRAINNGVLNTTKDPVDFGGIPDEWEEYFKKNIVTKPEPEKPVTNMNEALAQIKLNAIWAQIGVK